LWKKTSNARLREILNAILLPLPSAQRQLMHLLLRQTLQQAHDRNDEVLERVYIGRRFKNNTERVEKLFELYTKMTS
jgi:hypothetical protein